jgi:hypothetical protein
MRHDELLGHLGLSREQLRDLLKRFHDFFESLDERQREVVKRSLPSLKEASDSLGADIDEAGLLKLLEGEMERKPVMCFFPLVHHKSE